MSSIFKIIEQYEHDFINKNVEIVEGYDFNQLTTIKENQRYYAGKFISGDEDEFGFKFFYNISKSRVKNAVKNIDIDTKDINIRALKPADYCKAWIMRRDVVRWMKKRKLGKVLNQSVTMTPKYGTFVLKKVGGKEMVRPVNLKNLKNDPAAECLEHSGWVIEDHYYTPSELKKEVARGWDAEAVAKAIKSFRINRKENYDDNTTKTDEIGNAQYIHVKEFYGDVSRDVWGEGGDENEFLSANFIVVSPEQAQSQADNKELQKDGLILYKREIKSIGDIYKEVHYDREEGRWLGVGIVEDLKNAQIMKNEEINQVMLALKLANLILFQTNDETVARNILTDLVNGDIVKFKQAIQRIDTSGRSQSDNQIISQEIEKVANDLANSYEVTTGESLPSGTPFALGSLINQNANKLFDFVRENIGIFWQEVFEDWIIPELSKDLNKKHLLELTDKEEMDWVQEKLNRADLWEAIKKYILEIGQKPTQAEVALAEQVLSERVGNQESLPLDIPESFYDFEKTVIIDVTDERGNKSQQLQTLGTIMQMLNGNPALLDHPIMQKILDLSGYAEVDFRQRGAKQQPQPVETTQPQMQPVMS